MGAERVNRCYSGVVISVKYMRIKDMTRRDGSQWLATALELVDEISPLHDSVVIENER
jgi:hypothetical protein